MLDSVSVTVDCSCRIKDCFISALKQQLGDGSLNLDVHTGDACFLFPSAISLKAGLSA